MADTQDPQAHVVIVGTGFAGLGMAIRLKQLGVHTFTILERAASLGGTWRDNSYPGCACDIPSLLYSFSFEQDAKWRRKFGQRWQILAYLEQCAAKHDLLPHIRFNTAAVAAEFDESTGLWQVETSQGDTLHAKSLVAACGGLSQPRYPDIPGRELFQGASFHSSTWDHDFELAGAKVAVVGTGASAIQFVPQIAPKVAELRLFQRSPPWILPKADWAIHDRTRRLFARVPTLQKLVRWGQYLRQESRGIALVVEPRLLARGERMGLEHLGTQVKDPQLRARLTPSYKIGCKRVLLSNDYYPALARDNVQVVTDSITSIDASGVHTQDGAHHNVDAIIYGTGFVAADMLAPFRIRGLVGRDLSEQWHGGAEAHLGTSVAGFPNLFLLVGPNTGLGHNSMVFMIESQINYVLAALRALKSRQLRYLDVKPGAMRSFNERLHQRLDRGVWASGCSPWYLTKTGKNTVLWPGLAFEFRLRTRWLRLSDYTLVR